MSDKNLRDAEERLRQAEEERRSAEVEYRWAIRHDLFADERLALYAELRAARTKEQAARVKLVELQEASTSPAWGPVSNIDVYEAVDKAVAETIKAGGKNQAGTLDALRKARKSLVKSGDAGIAERIEAYAYLLKNVLKDDRGFFLFVDSCEALAKSWAGKMGTDDVEERTAAVLKTYFPDISKLYVKNVAEYQRRKAAGQKKLFCLGT